MISVSNLPLCLFDGPSVTMFTATMSNLIYKVASRREWHTAKQSGTYEGSPDDQRDGFIHFSTADQLAGTLAKHFAGQENLVLITIDADQLGNALKWEPSRSGALFPHLFGALAVTSAKNIQDLPLGVNGHVLPELENN